MQSIDLNCDMGESTALWPYSLAKDIELMQYVSAVNIACGYHAGDKETMKALAATAVQRQVAIGAHPSFPDNTNFGRSDMQLSLERIYEIIQDQLAILQPVVQAAGGSLHHVKPHGALYNMAAKNAEMSTAICRAVKDVDPKLVIYGLSGSELILAGNAMGLQTCSEVFADRTYQDDGSLTPRSSPQALITEGKKAVEQVLQMVTQEKVVTVSGKTIKIKAETICIHGDGVHAVAFARLIRQLLHKQQIAIQSA